MKIFLIALAVSSATLLIAVILLQQGKGAELGAAFGRGAQGGLFTSQGKANFLTRITSALATVFLLSSLALSIFLGSGQDGVLQELQGDTRADRIIEGEEAVILGSDAETTDSDSDIPAVIESEAPATDTNSDKIAE